MTVNPLAVCQFLDRKLANSDKAKRFTDGALDRKLAKLRPKLKLRKPLYRHQKIALLLCLKHPGYYVVLDPGLGKSRVVLEAFDHRRRKKRSRKLLVLVPGRSNVGGWAEQVSTWKPHLRFLALDEELTTEERRDALLSSRYDIACITYVGWMRLVTTPRKVKGKSRWVVEHKKAVKLERLFDEVCADESNEIENPDGLPFKCVRRLQRWCYARVPMTGTPFNKDPSVLWAQFYAADKGATLGPTLGLFRAAFFNERDNVFSGGTDYAFDERMWPDLHRAMKHRSIRFRDEECLDLPKKVGGLHKPLVRKVRFPRETMSYYRKLVEELRAARGNYKLLDNTYTRLRMLEAGYLPVRDDDGNRHDIVFDANPKLDDLVALLKQVPHDKKVIVACHYKKTGELIAQRLKQARIKYARLYGATRKPNAVVAKFKTGDVSKLRVLVASSAGAKGHNLQYACHHMVFYESPDDLRTRVQFERRIYRAGQEHTCFYWDMHVVGGICTRILAALREGKCLFDLVVDGRSDLLAAV